MNIWGVKIAAAELTKQDGRGKNPNSHKWTDKSKEKMSNSSKERHKKEKFGFLKGHKIRLGKKHTKKTKDNISDSLKGKPTWNKGLKLGKNSKHSEFMKGRFSREKSPSWRGGLSSQAELIRKSVEYKKWRETIFRRDDFTCQNPNCLYCNNNKGVFLHAHHIKSFADYSNLRFNITNGITYCAEYHYTFNGDMKNGC